MNNVFCYNCMSVLPANAAFCNICGVRREDIIPAPHHLTPGTVLMNRYTVGKVLGEGTFGITYIGYDNRMSLKVVVKEYYPRDSVSRDQTSLDVRCGAESEAEFSKGKSDFLRQTSAVASMGQTEAFIGISDSFEAHGTAYAVFRYAEGKKLSEFLESRGGKLPPEEVFALLEPVFPALEKYHSTGFIHRDISAENIIINNGRACLIDFGITGETPDSAASSSTVTVKNSYAPLEQLQSRGQGVWTDIYLLASVIYSCLMGTPPARPLDRMTGIKLKLPTEQGVNITPAQQDALIKCLGIKPEERFSSVKDMYYGLYPSGSAFAARPLNISLDAFQPPQPNPAPAPQQFVQPPRQNPAPAPQQFVQPPQPNPAPAPQQFVQPPQPNSTPAPQQFIQPQQQNPAPAPQQFVQPQQPNSTPAPQQFIQPQQQNPAPAPQQFVQPQQQNPAPAPQQFVQPQQPKPAPAPQQFVRPPQPNPAPAPQQFVQPQQQNPAPAQRPVTRAEDPSRSKSKKNKQESKVPSPPKTKFTQVQEQMNRPQPAEEPVIYTVNDTPAKTPLHKRRRFGVLIAVCVICILLIAAAAYYVFVIKGGEKNTDENSGAASETSVSEETAQQAMMQADHMILQI